MLADVMNIKWNYSYYQLWSDNKWLVDEILALLDEDITKMSNDSKWTLGS